LLLIRLAAQNLGRRRLRALLLGFAVALAVGVGVAGLVAGRALSEGIAASFSRMGADLVVVPRNTLVNLTASLLTVQPTDETLDSAIVAQLAAIAGVARAAPQRLVPVVVEGRSFNLIAFDPATDFTVQTWAREQRPTIRITSASPASISSPRYAARTPSCEEATTRRCACPTIRRAR